MSSPPRKSLMRNLGEFVGHIWKGARSDPSKKKQVLRKDVQEEQRGDITLRRTTIEEIEIRDDPRRSCRPALHTVPATMRGDS